MDALYQKPIKALLIACSLSLVVALAGVTSSQTVVAQDDDIEGEVTLMGYTGVFADNYTSTVVEGCMDMYPGIDVTYVETQTSAEMLSQLRAQVDSPQVDLALMDIAVANTGNQEGLFQQIDPSIVTNVEDLHEDAMVADNYGPGVTFDNYVMVYNTETVASEPTSWDALWDEEYAGRVIVTAPPNILGLAATIISSTLEGEDFNDSIDLGIERLAELGPNVLSFDAQPDVYTPIAGGDADIGAGWNARAQLYADQTDGLLGVTLPDEGSVFQINTINLVNGTENEEAAQTFMNCALSPEMQEAFAEQMYYAPVNLETELTDEVMDRTASSDEVMEQMISVDWVEIIEESDEWLDRWRREVIQ